jgi:hypothetical protein
MHYFDLIDLGEANAGDPTYACKFARMIVRWREVWNTRTNGTTDINFPFGFVQVSFYSNLSMTLLLFVPTWLKYIDMFIVINMDKR